jgi:primosomal protein N' (replication factor Y)
MGNYDLMLNQQLKDRKEYHYPPFNRLIRMVVNHSDMETVKKASQWIVNVLLQSNYAQTLGPVFPPIARVRNRYRMQILVKIEGFQSRDRVKKLIRKTLDRFESIAIFRSCKVNLDVDPY